MNSSLRNLNGDPSLSILDSDPTLRILNQAGFVSIISLSVRVFGTELSASPSHDYNVVIFVVYLYVFDLLMNVIDDDSYM